MSYLLNSATLEYECWQRSTWVTGRSGCWSCPNSSRSSNLAVCLSFSFLSPFPWIWSSEHLFYLHVVWNCISWDHPVNVKVHPAKGLIHTSFMHARQKSFIQWSSASEDTRMLAEVRCKHWNSVVELLLARGKVFKHIMLSTNFKSCFPASLWLKGTNYSFEI